MQGPMNYFLLFHQPIVNFQVEKEKIPNTRNKEKMPTFQQQLKHCALIAMHFLIISITQSFPNKNLPRNSSEKQTSQVTNHKFRPRSIHTSVSVLANYLWIGHRNPLPLPQIAITQQDPPPPLPHTLPILLFHPPHHYS